MRDHPRMRQRLMNDERFNSGASASLQFAPRCRRIFTVCHFSPLRAAQAIAGNVSPSSVINVAPAQVVLRIGLRGMTTEEKSEVRACIFGHLGSPDVPTVCDWK
jgi:hypothetical protein